MKYYKLVFYLASISIFSGCSEDVSVASDETGWHFQGRDCLACHNVDLGVDKNLVVAGTVFKEPVLSDIDNLDNVCDADMAIEFLNADYSIAYSSTNYFDANSDGNKGRGNIFLLDRLFGLSLNGSYYLRVIDRTNGDTLAQSAFFHAFSGTEFSIDDTSDTNNRLSCNACHNGGVTTPLYVQYNKTLCK